MDESMIMGQKFDNLSMDLFDDGPKHRELV
jgi:hypothetical protein